MTGIIYVPQQQGWEVFVDGVMVGFRVWDVAAQALLAKHVRTCAAIAGSVAPEAATDGPQRAIEAVADTEAQAAINGAEMAVEREKPRCGWATSIRRAFGLAKGAGLDTRDDEGMRAAISEYLGRAVASRSELSVGDWWLVAEGIERAELCW
jgi:hypothetical protein